MSIPAYRYTHATAAGREQPKLFTDALLASGRFYRNASSLLHLKIADGDFTRIANKHALREILLSGDFVKLEGDTDDAAFDCLWSWIIQRLWVLPRLDPGEPKPPPLPRSRTGYAYVHPTERVR